MDEKSVEKSVLYWVSCSESGWSTFRNKIAEFNRIAEESMIFIRNCYVELSEDEYLIIKLMFSGDEDFRIRKSIFK